jgi:hypothetical protein
MSATGDSRGLLACALTLAPALHAQSVGHALPKWTPATLDLHQSNDRRLRPRRIGLCHVETFIVPH